MADPAKVELAKRLQKVALARQLQAQKTTQSPSIGDQIVSAGQEALPAIGAGVEAFGRSASLGLATPMAAIVERALPSPTADLDAQLKAQGFKIVPAEEKSFSETIQSLEERARAQEGQFPIATGTGEVAGILSGGGLAGAGLRTAGRTIAPAAVRRGMSAALARGGLPAAAIKAGGAAAEAAGITKIEEATGKVEPGQAREAAGLAAGLQVAPGVLSKVAKVTGGKLLETLTGVKSKTVKRFLARAKEIKKLDEDQIRLKAAQAVEELKAAERETGEMVGEEVLLALNDLSSKTSQLSAEAFDVLERSGKKFDLGKIQGVIRTQAKGLSQRTSTSSNNARAVLDNFAKNLERKTTDKAGKITASQVKEIIQDLDEEIGQINNVAGGKLTIGEKALVQARRNLNQSLRTEVPEYVEIMDELAPLTEFSKAASKKLGTPDKATRAITTFGKGKIPTEQEKLLLKLAEDSNIDFEEFKRVQKRAAQVNAWNDSNFDRKFQSLVRGNMQNDRALMKAIGEKMPEENLERIIRNMRIDRELEQEFIRGSRIVNLFGFVGFGMGGPKGAAILAALGGMVDKFGARGAKSILSAYADIRGMPTVEKLRKLPIPKEQKEYLISGFRNGIIRAHNDEPTVEVPQDARAQLHRDINSSKALSPLEKAKMQAQMNRQGEIDTSMIKKFMNSGSDYEAPKASDFQSKKPDRPVRSYKDAAEFVKYRRPKDF